MKTTQLKLVSLETEVSSRLSSNNLLLSFPWPNIIYRTFHQLFTPIIENSSFKKKGKGVNIWELYFLFLSLEHKLIHTSTLGLLTDWLTDWLTHWLICLHNALRNMAKVKKNHTLAKRLQDFRQQVTFPTLLGDYNLRRILLRRTSG